MNRLRNKWMERTLLLGLVLCLMATTVASASLLSNKTAIVTISMDDIYDGQYKYAYPILHDRNINATVFVNTGNVGQTAGNGTITYLTDPQLTEMRDAGWEIASHTVTHPDMTTLNNSQLEYEVKGSKNYLIAHGFNPQTFAYPYGKYNDDVTQVVKKYYVIARNTNQGMNPIPLDITSFNLEGRGVDNQNEIVIKGWIDEAIANNQWLVLYFHNINASGYINTSATEGGQNLTVIADYIKSKVNAGQLKALTFYQGWLEATNIPPSSSSLSTIVSNFNGNPIQAGNFIWFNSNMKVTGMSDGTVIQFSESKIEFTANGIPYSLDVPGGIVTFSSGATSPTTVFDQVAGVWKTTVPITGSDEIFLSGLDYNVQSGGLPGGINPVTWSGRFECLSKCSSSGVNIQWKWGAAVYTKGAWDYNALGVIPIHDKQLYGGLHAGTPVNFEDYVIGGARGGGGSNYVGSWSAAKSIVLYAIT
jgi:peptidoglycan/xylan/chitin deacetylase (PgdA/CDA1 family)